MARQSTQQKTPAKKKGNEPAKIATFIGRQFLGSQILISLLFVLMLAGTGGGLYYYYAVMQAQPLTQWIIPVGAAVGSLLIFGVLVIVTISSLKARLRTVSVQVLEDEVGDLRAANRRAQALQEMAAIMRSTLNFEKVVKAAVETCAAVLEEFGVPQKNMVAAVMTFSSGQGRLTVVADWRLEPANNQFSTGQQGIIAECMQYAEPVVTTDPRNDPELREYTGFKRCKTVVAFPLRLGFDMYGVMLVGSEIQINLDQGQLDMFNAISDQTVIALRNAQLYEDVERQKQQLIETANEERKQLARSLHDGPTQSVAAIAMRVNFIRSLLRSEPQIVPEELAKVEELAKETGKEIRGMLFSLRPLLVVDQGVSAAVEKVIERLREMDGLTIHFQGGEYGNLLSQQAQMTVFHVVEEALGNARKYSRAKSIGVHFWQEEELFVCQIRDDGVGFDVDGVMDGYSERGSLGMINMEERAKMIDGTIKVESAVGQGTMITLIVPLDKHGVRGR